MRPSTIYCCDILQVPAHVEGYQKISTYTLIEDGTPERKVSEQMMLLSKAANARIPPGYEIYKDNFVVSEYDLWHKWHKLSCIAFVRPAKLIRSRLYIFLGACMLCLL